MARTVEEKAINENVITQEFTLEDPFNPGNAVKGLLFKNGDQYGDLKILAVNGKECEQYIHTTPKFYYPGFSKSPTKVKEGYFPEFETIKAFEKIDGTNVCLFRYEDADGSNFVSFKTRLVPFMNPSGKNGFMAMWNKMLEKYSDKFEILLEETRYNFAFELFGALNKILVDYDVPLDTRLLFVIDRATGEIHDPTGFDFPAPDLVKEIGKDENPDETYKKLVYEYEKAFNQGKPVEGCMVYVIKADGTAIPFKCKPPSVIEASSGGGMHVSFNEAYVTAMNAMDSAGTIDRLHAETYELLAEVYDKEKIEISKGYIEK
ncbi:MAG: hypothetical protein ACFFCS_18790, partial [Candidatus Hodarchaeota archaeon]